MDNLDNFISSLFSKYDIFVQFAISDFFLYSKKKMKDEKSAEVTRLMALMALGIKCGQEVRVTAEGPDEEAAADGIKAFLEANL